MSKSHNYVKGNAINQAPIQTPETVTEKFLIGMIKFIHNTLTYLANQWDLLHEIFESYESLKTML